MAYIPNQNTSVSGTVGSSTIGWTPVTGSVAVYQGTNPWITTGSVQGVMSVLGTVPVTQSGPWITSVSGGISSVSQVGNWHVQPASVQVLAGTNMIGSIATYQGASAPWRVELTSGSIATTAGTTGNSSVQLVGGTAMVGSVAAYQGSSPWTVQLTSGSVTTTGGNSSVMLTPGTNTIGSVTALQGTNPWVIVGSVQASLTPAANQSVSGTVGASLVGVALANTGDGDVARIGLVTDARNKVWNGTGWDRQKGDLVSGTLTSIYGVPNVSVVGGNLGVTQITNPWVMVGSISGGVSSVSQVGQWNMAPSSVMLFGSTNTSVVALVSRIMTGVSSVQLMAGTNNQGSVTAIQGTNPFIIGSNNNSILTTGTYIEDAAHSFSDRGVFNMGVRNDTLSSMTTADNDYTPMTVGPAGEMIAVNSPYIKWVQGTANVTTGTSVQAIAPQGASIFTYITAVQVANASANNVYVTFTGGNGSILGYTAAPANGGSNILYPNGLKTGANSGFSASVSGVSSVYVSAQGFIAKS